MSLTVRAPEPSDQNPMLEWRNAPRVRAVSTTDRLITPEEHEQWFTNMLAQHRNEILIVQWNDAPAGVVQLEQLDREQQVSSWGVHLGDAAVRPGVGAALPAVGLGLGFGRFGLRRMTAVVLSANKNMLAMHRRLAIPIEGRRRKAVRRSDGVLLDVVEFGVLDSEWAAIMESCERLLPSSLRTDLHQIVNGLVQSRASV